MKESGGNYRVSDNSMNADDIAAERSYKAAFRAGMQSEKEKARQSRNSVIAKVLVLTAMFGAVAAMSFMEADMCQRGDKISCENMGSLIP